MNEKKRTSEEFDKESKFNRNPKSMDLTFLGTASNNPSPTRGVSCSCFRFGQFNIFINLILNSY